MIRTPEGVIPSEARDLHTAVSVRDILAELLPPEANDRGVAAVSVVERRGADPISVWTLSWRPLCVSLSRSLSVYYSQHPLPLSATPPSKGRQRRAWRRSA